VETLPKGASNSQLQDVNGWVKPLSEYPNWLFYPSAIKIARFHFQLVCDWEAKSGTTPHGATGQFRARLAAVWLSYLSHHARLIVSTRAVIRWAGGLIRYAPGSLAYRLGTW